MGPSLINKTTQTPLAVAVVALAVISSGVWKNFAGTAEENSVGVACLDRVGPGSSHRGPSLGLGCGSSKHRADSCAVARKRLTKLCAGVEPQALPWLWGWCRLILEVILTPSSPARWSLPLSWQAEAPLVPVGQHLQAGVRRREVHLELPRVDCCPKPARVAPLGRWRTGSLESLYCCDPYQPCDCGRFQSPR